MSLPNFSGQSALFATLTSGFFGPEDRCRLLAQKIYPVLVQARGTLEQVYCSDNGRPGVEPVLLAGVALLQFLEGAPTARPLRCSIITWAGSLPSTAP